MKKLLSLLIVAFVSSIAMASPISHQQAQKIAQTFAKKLGRSIESTAISRRKANAKDAAYYIFNADKGFVVVSGDDRTPAILGYTDEGNYHSETLAPALQYMLDCYSDEIANLDSEALTPTAKREPVEPLLTTRWDQWSGSLYVPTYNKFCPTTDIAAGRAYSLTGCVATAMAQIMRYHRWPQAQTAAIPASQTSYVGVLPRLEPITFDWDNMPDQLYATIDGTLKPDGGKAESSEAEIDAVAQLMRYCGQGVNMDYYFTVSNAYVEEHTPAVFANYFGYDKNARCCRRASFSIDDWETLIYNEVSEGRPVLYAGSATGGGHCFVCDGADAEGLFHINWGWSGENNGYFRLGILNPGGQGAGASTDMEGYSMQQIVITGIQPPTGEPLGAPYMVTTNTMVSGDNVIYDFTNASAQSSSFMLGLGYLDEQDGLHALVERGPYAELQPGAKMNSISFNTYSEVRPLLTDGVYHLVPMYKPVGENYNEWTACPEGPVYAELTVFDNAEDCKVTKHPIQKIKAEGFNFTGTLCAKELQPVVVSIVNEGEEVNGNVYLFASKTGSKGMALFRSGLFVKKNTTETLDLQFTPAEAGTYNIWLCTDNAGRNVIGQTTVDIMEQSGIIELQNANEGAAKVPAYNLTGQRTNEKGSRIEIRKGKKILKGT